MYIKTALLSADIDREREDIYIYIKETGENKRGYGATFLTRRNASAHLRIFT